jgi:hypothetical protein
MDLKRKLELAAQTVASIADHDDSDATVRLAALDKVQALLDTQRAAIAARVADEVAAQLGA